MKLGGLLNITRNGKRYTAEGHFDYNLGLPKKVGQMDSAGRMVGYVEEPQKNFIKGNIYVGADDSIVDILQEEELTVVLELNNGKSIVLSQAWNESEGTLNSEKNLMEIELVGFKAEEA